MVTAGGSHPALQEVLDLQLQLGVGFLQRAHLVQVGSQPIVQVLHGDLLVGRDVDGVGQVEAGSNGSSGTRGRGGEGGPGDSDPVAACSSVDAADYSGAGGGEGGAHHAGGPVAGAGEGGHGGWSAGRLDGVSE